MTAVGTFLYVRFMPPDMRSKWMGPLAIATGMPFAVCVVKPSLVISLALWAIAGTGMAYQVQVMSSYVRGVPPEKLDVLISRQAIKRYGEMRDVIQVLDFFIDPASDFVTGQVIFLGGV